MKIDLKNCTLLILRARNLTSLAATNGLYVKFGDGTLTYNIRQNITYEKDRGKLEDVRRGDEVPLDVAITAKYEYIHNPPSITAAYSITEALDGVDANGTPVDWLDQTPPVGGIDREPWLDCAPYCVQLELHNDLRYTCPNVLIPGEAYLFPFFRTEASNIDTKAGTIQITGKCNVTDPLTMRVGPGATGYPWPYNLEDPVIPLTYWPAL